MEPNFPEEFAAQKRAVVIAPAGCGKTELIARAVGCSKSGKQLVLTHTHAGVKSLKDRLGKHGVSSSRFRVETIASFSLRYATSFPETASFHIRCPQDNREYLETYDAAKRVLSAEFTKDIIKNTYAGLYVDEYQDCTVRQHGLIMSLAEDLPCRIVGDPLQGIFDFSEYDPLIDWENDIFPNFKRLKNLDTAYRWKDKNEELGDWLMDVREDLVAGNVIDLSKGPKGVKWKLLNNANQRNVCYEMAQQTDRAIAVIHKLPHEAHSLAKTLRGIYSSMEEIECNDLIKYCEKLQLSTGLKRALTIIEFASKSITKVSTELNTIRNKIKNGDKLPGNISKFRDVAIGLSNVIENDSIENVIGVMRIIEAETRGYIYRRELWREMLKSLREYSSGKYETLKDAAWHIRHNYRVMGRMVPAKCVTRTLLIKGLEFDCTVVADADSLSTKELYVALTRASTSMTILSSMHSIQKEAIPLP